MFDSCIHIPSCIYDRWRLEEQSSCIFVYLKRNLALQIPNDLLKVSTLYWKGIGFDCVGNSVGVLSRSVNTLLRGVDTSLYKFFLASVIRCQHLEDVINNFTAFQKIHVVLLQVVDTWYLGVNTMNMKHALLLSQPGINFN